MTSRAAPPPRSRDDFHVAIICALTFEFDAVVASLDQDWDDTIGLGMTLEDSEAYTLGRIGQHDVVVVMLPDMGKASSASATAVLRARFINIRLALLVGVCGGAPKTADGKEVTLGDVLVSTRVIQSDFGRQLPDRLYVKDTLEDALARPSSKIRSFLKKLSSLKTKERLSVNAFANLACILDQRGFEESQYPGITEDELFKPHYRHKHRKQDQCATCNKCENDWDPVCDEARKATCADLGCSDDMLISRSHLAAATSGTNTPKLFQGIFASGDQVIKSASHRDKLSSTYKVIGFEMEGAGAWDNFPAIIVKGVCDYADTHKSKNWQPYAAVSAAAYAKALLAEWSAAGNKSVQSKATVNDHASSIMASQIAPIHALSPTNEAARPRVRPLRTRNTLFLGRAAELDKIEDQFLRRPESEQDAVRREPRVIVLYGPGGNGKSEICLRYLSKHEQRYWAIFWIDGSSESSLKSGFEQIAKQLGLGDANHLDSFHNLASQKQPWLLIIDNADDPGLRLAPYLPTEGIGHVVITTRNPKLRKYHNTLCMAVQGLAEEDALKLLFMTAEIPDQEQESSTESAENILKILDFHTLAIIQAGTFIQTTRDINGYVRFFEEQRKVVLEYCDAQVDSEYGSVYATFEVSASKLQQEANQRQDGAAADALELLRLFAFMDSRGAFERIFCNARDFATECSLPDTATVSTNDAIEIDNLKAFARRHSALLPSIAYAGISIAGKYRWRQACDKLYEFSMLSFEKNDDGDEVLSFHPLILAWAMARQPKDLYRRSWLSVATIVCLSNWGNRYNSPLLYPLGSHSRVCASHVSDNWWTDTSNLTFLTLLYELAWILLLNRDDNENTKVCYCLEIGLTTIERQQHPIYNGRENIRYLLGMHANNVGNISLSLSLLERLVKVEEQTLAETHPDRLDCQHGLAQAYLSNGQIDQAVQLLEHVIKVEEQTLAETHPDRLTSQYTLAQAYCSNGQTDQAVQLLEYVVKVGQQTETHPDRLASQHALAQAYRSNGQIDQAVQLLEYIVKVRQQTETHPDRLTSQHALAQAYLSNGQIDQAVQLLEYIVKVGQQTETHPDRLTSQHTLAQAYLSNGQIDQAVQLLEYIVKVGQQTETHPDRLTSQHTLAQAYLSNGQIDQAVQLLEHVVKVKEQTLAETHPDRLVSQHTLAQAYESNGQIDQAVQLLEHVIKIEEQSLAETHPDQLASQHTLAQAYLSNGQIDQAVQLLEHVVKVKEQTLVETHPDRLVSQHTLAQAYESNGQIDQAVQLLEHVVKVKEQTLVETHPDRLVSQHTLAQAYESNGQIDQAVQLLEYVVKVREQTLAETHPERLASQHTLAHAYESNGQIDQAVQLLEHVVKIQEQTLAETHPDRLVSEELLCHLKSCQS